MNALSAGWCAEIHAEYGPCTLPSLHEGAHWNNGTKEPWVRDEPPRNDDLEDVLYALLRRAYNCGCLPGDLEDEVAVALRRFVSQKGNKNGRAFGCGAVQ